MSFHATLHTIFYDAISEAVNIPIINIIEETVRYAVEKNHVKNNLGILATSGTIHSLTYHRVCESYGLNCIIPDDTVQNAVMDIIYNQVKAGIAVNPRRKCTPSSIICGRAAVRR